MKKYLFHMFLFAVFSGLIGCAATKESGDRPNPKRFTERIGKVTRTDFHKGARTVLQNRFQYQFERTEQSEAELYVETLWRYRNPLEDEANAGVVNVRSKIILSAYPRELNKPYSLWIAKMEGRNEIKLQGTEQWVTAPLTDDTQEYFDEIAEDLKIEFRMGVREF